jgi:4-amino-4-deoxy-L-arabinose transferase-like glycosyltransferase
MGENVDHVHTASGGDRGIRLLLLGIVALALVLRMGWPTLSEFKRDEATVARRALAIAYEGDLPAAGVASSTGTANFPLTLYLMAIPLRLWKDLVAVVLFTGLLNGLAVLACYAVGRAYFGRAVGVLTAFLFAVGPWAVVYGRKVWSQNLPLITLGFFAALFATFVRGKRWALVGAFIGLAALIGLHLGGLAFVPVLLISMLLYRKQVALWPLLVGLLLFALAVSPYVIHDALRGWPNLRAFLNYAGGEARLSWDALRSAFLLTGSQGIHGMAGGLYPEYLAGLPNLWWLNWLMMGLLAVALLYGLVQVIRGPEERRRSIILLLLWFAVPIALQSRPTAPVYPFYFLLLYPVQFFLIAILLVDLLSHLPSLKPRLVGRRLPAPVLLLAVALLVWGGWQVAVLGRLFVFMDQHPTTGGHGISLKYPRAAARSARWLAGSSEVIVLSTGADPAVDETPAVFEALLFDHPHRFADGRWALPVPDSPEVVYLVGPVRESSSDLWPVLERLEAMENVQSGPVIAMPDGWDYRLFYRGGQDREDVLAGLTRFPEVVPFANGTAFLGYGVAETVLTGRTLEVWLAWWVRSPQVHGTSFHFFTHLLDEEGALRSQHDGSGFPTGSWHAGDLVVSRFAILVPPDLPSGRYQVWAGLYTYPDVVNVPIMDVAGNPAGDRVLLGEVEVIH